LFTASKHTAAILSLASFWCCGHSLAGGRRVDCLLADVVFPVLEVLLAEGEGHHLQLECGPLFLKPALPVPELRLTIPQLAGTVMEVLLLLRDGAKLLLSAQLLGH
jgi:hypothetical protein